MSADARGMGATGKERTRVLPRDPDVQADGKEASGGHAKPVTDTHLCLLLRPASFPAIFSTTTGGIRNCLSLSVSSTKPAPAVATCPDLWLPSLGTSASSVRSALCGRVPSPDATGRMDLVDSPY